MAPVTYWAVIKHVLVESVMPPAWAQLNEAIEELASRDELDRSLGCNGMVTYISLFAQKEHETAKIVSSTIDDFTLFDVYPFSIFSSGLLVMFWPSLLLYPYATTPLDSFSYSIIIMQHAYKK